MIVVRDPQAVPRTMYDLPTLAFEPDEVRRHCEGGLSGKRPGKPPE